MPKIILSVDGGIGKCITATALCKAINKQYPNDELVVLSGYPDVFTNNPNVSKSLRHGHTPYFYTEYIEGQDTRLLLHNPYLENDYVHETKHLIEIWCNMFGIKYNGEMPELFLTEREQTLYSRRFNAEKPIMLLQTNGGGISEMKYSFARDIPSVAVLKIIEHFSKDYTIFHVRRDDQIAYPNTVHVQGEFKEILALALLSKKRLLIDSFLQHACAALNLPSTVCWITNSPKVLGYDLHDNILANPFTKKPELRNSYISKFDIGGDVSQYPYNHDAEIFDVDKIIDSVEKFNELLKATPSQTDAALVEVENVTVEVVPLTDKETEPVDEKVK